MAAKTYRLKAAKPISQQRRASLCKLHIGSGFVFPEPTARNGKLEAVGTASCLMMRTVIRHQPRGEAAAACDEGSRYLAT